MNTAWRTGIRRIWQVLNTTHSALSPGLCESIPLLDTFYLRMLKYGHKCIRSESSLVNYIVRRGIMIGPTDSIIGRNILNCSLRYHVSLGDIANLRFQPCNIYKLFNVNEDNLVGLPLLRELLQCRDGALCLSDNNFSMSDIIMMINYLCPCWHYYRDKYYEYELKF